MSERDEPRQNTTDECGGNVGEGWYHYRENGVPLRTDGRRIEWLDQYGYWSLWRRPLTPG